MRDVSNSNRQYEDDLVRTYYEWCRTLHSPWLLYCLTFGMTFRRQFAAVAIASPRIIFPHYLFTVALAGLPRTARFNRRVRCQEGQGKDAAQIGSVVFSQRPWRIQAIWTVNCLSNADPRIDWIGDINHHKQVWGGYVGLLFISSWLTWVSIHYLLVGLNFLASCKCVTPRIMIIVSYFKIPITMFWYHQISFSSV